MIEISRKFLKPNYKNDTLYRDLEIIDLVSQKTTGIIEMKTKILNKIIIWYLKVFKNIY